MVASSIDRQRLRRDLLAQLAGEKRRVPVNRAAVHRVEQIAQQRRAPCAARRSPALSAWRLCADSSGAARVPRRAGPPLPRSPARRLGATTCASSRAPSSRSLGHRDHAQPAARGAVAAHETARIGEHARAQCTNRTTRPPNSECADRRQARPLPPGAPARSSTPSPSPRWRRRRAADRRSILPSSSGSGKPA